MSLSVGGWGTHDAKDFPGTQRTACYRLVDDEGICRAMRMSTNLGTSILAFHMD